MPMLLPPHHMDRHDYLPASTWYPNGLNVRPGKSCRRSVLLVPGGRLPHQMKPYPTNVTHSMLQQALPSAQGLRSPAYLCTQIHSHFSKWPSFSSASCRTSSSLTPATAAKARMACPESASVPMCTSPWRLLSSCAWKGCIHLRELLHLCSGKAALNADRRHSKPPV